MLVRILTSKTLNMWPKVHHLREIYGENQSFESRKFAAGCGKIATF